MWMAQWEECGFLETTEDNHRGGMHKNIKGNNKTYNVRFNRKYKI